MAIIEKEDYIFDVDIGKTKEYYATRTLCDCNECQNYYRQAENTFPKLTSFLLDFGIDIAHSDEDYQTYTLDGCHPNENGHRRIAEKLFELCSNLGLIDK